MPETSIKVTKVGRLSFPSLFKPKEGDKPGDKAYYEATLIFPASADLSQEEQAVTDAATKKWGKDAAAKLKKVKYFPIKSNADCTDAECKRRAGYEEDEGRNIKFKNELKPGVKSNVRDPANPLSWLDMQQGEIYAGCYVRASYTCFAGDHPTLGPYVRFSLQNIQFIKEGEPFGGTISNADDDFADDPAVLAALA